MRLVVADTGPLNYLVLIDEIGLLPKLFAKIHVPLAVLEELRDEAAPQRVRDWAVDLPTWLNVHDVTPTDNDPILAKLDVGERDALVLAAAMHADVVLMDDRAGRKNVTGS